MNEQSSSVATATSSAATTKPLLEAICFPACVSMQESWVRRFIRENPWTSDCLHESSQVVISENEKRIELARKQINLPINTSLHCIYYHFAAFVTVDGERYKLRDSDYLCFGLEDFKTHIDKMALFFKFHDIELTIRSD